MESIWLMVCVFRLLRSLRRMLVVLLLLGVGFTFRVVAAVFVVIGCLICVSCFSIVVCGFMSSRWLCSWFMLFCF